MLLTCFRVDGDPLGFREQEVQPREEDALGHRIWLWGGLIVSIQLLKHISSPPCTCYGADAHGWLWMESCPMEEQSDSGICAVSPGGGFCFEVPTLAVG